MKTAASTIGKYKLTSQPRPAGSRFERSKPSKEEADLTELAKPLQNMLSDICLGSSSKMSVLKMQVVRSEEFLQYFQRARQLICEGLMLDAD